MEIINRISELFNETKKKRIDLAQTLEINSSTLSTWEKRNKDPEAKYIMRICKFFDVDVLWLLTGDGDKYSKNINISLSNEKLELLDMWDKLTEKQKGKAEYFFEQMIEENLKAKRGEKKIG